MADHDPVQSPESTDNPPKQSPFAKWKAARAEKAAEKKLKDEQSDKLPPVPFLALFKYATNYEYMIMLLASIAAIGHGALLPIFTILFGDIITSFEVPDANSPEDTANFDFDSLVDEIGSVAKWFVVLAVIAFITSLIQVRFQLIFAQRVSARLRSLFFRSLMSQDYTWYDTNNGGELTARVAGDVDLIQAGIGDKFTSAVQFMSQFLVGIIIAFSYGWKLTFVVLAVSPLLAIAGSVFGNLAAESTSDGLGAYGTAGAIANEVIGLIRTVTAYNGQQSEMRRYDVELQKAYKSGVRKSVFGGLALGSTFLLVFCTYGLAFWFGAGQVRNGSMEPGAVLTTFFSVLIAAFSLGQAAPAFNALSVARGAAPRVYDVIERQSEINPLDEDNGEILDTVRGHIEFQGVDFDYKNRVRDDLDEDSGRQFVLNNFNLNVASGSSQALVGPSGCGKSSCVRLVERFYDVQNGKVLIDGHDVRDLNVRWLRSQIGYVGQMPSLFMLSIRDNIALGAAMEPVLDKDSGKTVLQRQEVTEEQIIQAAKQANAHDFIMKLPEQYNTMLGERGALLSGGQKQRVCIARAIIRNPKILILDESTAALDAQSERIVQDALEKASEGRTTITIAHRLSTVKNADVISVIEKGTIVESGTHYELLAKENGAYKTLVEHQNVVAQKIETTAASRKSDRSSMDAANVFNTSISKTGQIQEGEGTSEDDDEPDVDRDVLRRTFRLNATEWPLIILGSFGAALAGASFPVMAIIFSEVINVLVTTNTPSEVRRWSLYFVAIGGGAFIGNFFQLFMLGVSGERLTRKLRRESFRVLLKQEMGFFDEKKNAVGALTTRLATEATLVKGIIGDTLGAIVYVSSAILSGFIIAYVACWRVALVVTAIFPLMAIAGALQIKAISGFDADSHKKYAAAGAVASEAVDNFDTVTSIGVQDIFMDRYGEELKIPIQNGQRTALVAGIAFGVSEFMAQALWAVSFWVGSIFVGPDSGDCSFLGLMKAISGLLFAGMSIGQVSTFLPDVAKSKLAATKIFRLLDRESQIDPSNTDGVKDAVRGSVQAKDLEFEYPTRPDVHVLRGLSVKVSPGQTLALVGESGCGKSTIVALIERFYDARTGVLSVDDRDITEYNLGSIRGQMGLVSQEPDLFDRSVRDNIAYGLSQEDGTAVTESMITTAAQAANAHGFIADLPDGYDTIVGPRGSRLSGGQRQRVAIARALVREPRILLLDEATSALDAVSEKNVQQTLDKARLGRTTIAIAHRLSTIKDADIIAVVKNGRVVESGRHEALLKIKDGVYANLVRNQMEEIAAE